MIKMNNLYPCRTIQERPKLFQLHMTFSKDDYMVNNNNTVQSLPRLISRRRKKVRMAFLARSTSPQGSRLRNSMPVNGVPVNNSRLDTIIIKLARF